MAKDKPVQLNLSRSIFNDKFFPLVFDYSHRWEVYKGSAGSGKSHFISQKLIIKGLNDPGRRILVCRRYGSTVRETVWQLILEQLRFFQIEHLCNINKTERTIELPNGTQFIFFGLDEETKLLSLQNISDVWVEEVFECRRDVVEQLNLRMRGSKSNQQLFLSFNPISAAHWLYDFCEVNPPKNFMYHQSTFRDNAFLPKPYIESLEDLYRTNPVKARVYCDGDWGVDYNGLVYPNHREEDFDINIDQLISSQTMNNNDFYVNLDNLADIEFAYCRAIFGGGATNTTVDNICFKYTGDHGIATGSIFYNPDEDWKPYFKGLKNFTVRNCEFGCDVWQIWYRFDQRSK